MKKDYTRKMWKITKKVIVEKKTELSRLIVEMQICQNG